MRSVEQQLALVMDAAVKPEPVRTAIAHALGLMCAEEVQANQPQGMSKSPTPTNRRSSCERACPGVRKVFNNEGADRDEVRVETFDVAR